ncbi:2-octaprenyl-3-methyl-6-methoxy-1,4-benzoquinol hydroxylase [Vibrio sp. ZSDZ34]|uniref:2-octaprenyl-3-methyl-6-methoxy-1,4-benzoquinol hydroxylase n=1 Tax=Vibrio gelatinilyticus TaxID=2893468 RepID=A0A9X1WEP7_9VIBR|nr:2-octaprenyl-3-methyl-6-methoxy-1,4-benzoquinol hydroxylase [Vibrio gelatinilyticus]MCJ2375629.1 2-octaprenyl-3-methyl-6-methoxy-1,4-benzoquinol hydroxylase [Vibrio gelatinilyticus]
MKQYEIAVIGGGMVGAATALGLAKQGRNVVLVEPYPPRSFSVDQPMDLRVSAISHQSVTLLNELGAWDSIKSMRVCPYSRLETWEIDSCRTRFNSAALGLDSLGYIAENRVIQLGLWQQFSAFENLTVIESGALDSIALTDEQHQISLVDGTLFSASWVVGADGANSKVRDIAGIGVTAWDYRQECMLINVTTEKPQQDITWQWFTPSGPRSFLPLPGHKGSLVWYDSPKRIRQLKSMDNKRLQEEIETHFPNELGGVEVEQVGSFPLTRRHAQQYFKQRCILVGDSAHTINPLAGQGVNLGFKDVAQLLKVTEQEQGLSEGAARAYQWARKPDNLLMQTGMDIFYKGFKESFPPLMLARNALLKVAENAGPLKKRILKYAIGLN